MALRNKKLLKPRWKDATLFLQLTLLLASMQVRRSDLFFFEHPASASSWATITIKKLCALPGVRVAKFDQCRLGLVSPSGKPMQKSTCIATNSPVLHMALHGLRCRCPPGSHKLIEGSEHGHRLSSWAAIYPQRMCETIAESILQQIR